MELRFTASDLEQLDADAGFTAGLAFDAVETFHAVIQHIWASEDERDLLSPRWLEVQREDDRDGKVFSVALDRLVRLELELSGDVVNVRGLLTAEEGGVRYA